MTRSAYGLAITILALIAAFVVSLVMDSRVVVRLGLAILSIGAMSYIASASTLPYVLDTVINADTLPPAPIYPAITGMKFIPLLILVVGFCVVLSFCGDQGFRRRPGLRAAYLILGPIFLLATASCLFLASSDYGIWQDRVPGASTLVIGYAVVVLLNVGLWLGAYRLFNREKISLRPIVGLCAAVYLPLALAAAFVDGEYNLINRYHLDERRPVAYRVENPDAIKRFQRGIPPELGHEIGVNLLGLLKDPQFEHILRTQVFYKQDFDEAFQLSRRTVMFGYRMLSPNGQSVFQIIRFPKSLAEELRFTAIR